MNKTRSGNEPPAQTDSNPMLRVVCALTPTRTTPCPLLVSRGRFISSTKTTNVRYIFGGVSRAARPDNREEEEAVIFDFEEVEESETGSTEVEAVGEEEEFLEDWFEEEGGPASGIQETVALALGALFLVSFLNIALRLLAVGISVAAVAFKYSVVGILLIATALFFSF
ncbi:hypothetical protein BSKO_02961 [Bryopsis sp. KO-2023]|nr:hypothetical protein BSKO_02961 [Bryopsis sp. KO-2023]